MKRLTRMSSVLIGVCCLVGLVFGTAAAFSTRGAVQGDARRGQKVPSGVQRHVASTQGIRAAAELVGQYVGEVGYPEAGGPATLEELAALVDTVLLARVEDNLCALSADGQMIVTHFNLHVEEVLAGSVASDVVSLAILGGKVVFNDGKWAQLNVRNFTPPERGHRVVLFARVAPSDLKRTSGSTVPTRAEYVPAAGPLGLFDLDVSASRHPYVLPAGSPRSVLSRTLLKSKLTADAFVAAVRRLPRMR